MTSDGTFWDRYGKVPGSIGGYLAVLQRRGLELNAARRVITSMSAAPSWRRGQLAGLPFAVKENFDVAGWPTVNGMAHEPSPPTRDASVVSRLRAAGAIPVAQCAMDEAALGGSTDNPHYGRTANPRAPGRTPGGSSGGSAALVAAGLVPFALGTDTLGSVRIPASYCGIVGFKPSRGRVSLAGVFPLAPSLDCVGVLAATVEDARLAFEAIRGSESDDSTIWSTQGPMTDAPEDLLGLAETLKNGRIDAGVVEVLGRAIDRLTQAGFAFERGVLASWRPDETRRAGFLVMEAEGAVVHAASLEGRGPPLSPQLRRLLEYGRDCGTQRLDRAHAAIDAARRAAADAFERMRFLVLPTTPQSAFRFEDKAPENQANFTALASVAGLPAISLPCGSDRDGLPVGLQIIARPGDDAGLLGLAMRVEAALGDAQRPR